MHRMALPVVLVVAAALGVSCGDDPLTVYADLQWNVRCVEHGGCTGYPGRDVLGFDGELGFSISCTATRIGDDVTFYVSAFHGSDWGMSINGVNVGPSGGTVHGACQVRVQEDQDFRGNCGSNPPSDTAPCQVSEVTIAGTTISGQVLCEDLESTTDATVLREVTHPSSSAKAAAFSFLNCTGL